MPAKRTKAETDAAAVEAKIAEWPPPYRAIGERIHEIILETVPELRPRIWYGAPGYAKDGPVLVFFRHDDGNLSFGLTEKANTEVEKGATDQLVGSAWFVKDLDEPTEKRIAEIVGKASS